ncbi:MAG: nitroreductase family protein [Pseudomonadota bacterium]
MLKPAITDQTILDEIINRWSSKRFSEKTVDPDLINQILEAARWAPSSRNGQPWRFIVAERQNEAFQKIIDSMPESNSNWAQRASNLLVANVYRPEGQDNPTAEYDVGQSVAYMVLQATNLGLSTHQIGGFDREALASKFELDATVAPLVVIAIGYFDENTALPEHLMKREMAARARHPIKDLIVE